MGGESPAGARAVDKRRPSDRYLYSVNGCGEVTVNKGDEKPAAAQCTQTHLSSLCPTHRDNMTVLLTKDTWFYVKMEYWLRYTH